MTEIRKCPMCQRNKAMRPGNDLTGRHWPGSLCRFCGYHVPDVLSENYQIKCQECEKSIGSRDFDRYWHDLEEEKIQEVLRAEASRAASAKAKLDALVSRKEIEKDPDVLKSINGGIDEILKENLHVPRDLKIPSSWQKRHAELRINHFCSDCHKKRHDAGVDFEEISSYVSHEIGCSVCKKVVGYVYVAEHYTPDQHRQMILMSAMDCTGDCSEKTAKLAAIIKKVTE